MFCLIEVVFCLLCCCCRRYFEECAWEPMWCRPSRGGLHTM